MAKDMLTYQEQLKTNEWQKKRFSILTRDDFTCYLCGYRGSRLNVHHLKYLPNKKAWEYPDNLLFTVCYSCHRIIHTPDLVIKRMNSTRVGNLIKEVLK